IKRSWGIALFGAIAPFITAYSVANYYWQDTNIALMCGLTMTATAVSLTMVSLRSEGLSSSPAATRIMTSAVLDSIASLVLVAVLVAYVTSDHSLSMVELGLIIFKAIVFFIMVTIVGAWVFPHPVKGWIQKIPVLSHFGIRHILAFNRGEHAVLIVLLLAVGTGILAHQFGFHPAVGAYMAGLILREEYFDVVKANTLTKKSYHDTMRIIDSIAFTWIGPVFFVELGTKLVFDWDIFVSVIPQTFVMTVSLMFAQVTSAALAARYISGMNKAGSIMVGLGMLGRAELAFVVMDIAYVQNSVLSTEAFFTLMFTAFWLNVSVPISIRLWKPYYQSELEE
ncbi:MAG: cation:proton antiporter, partial [Gammaproteobacteria bacterium]|nr:cation:proton antiporter [Gammaproteobacteria bacterium]